MLLLLKNGFKTFRHEPLASILLTKTTAAQTEHALSYYTVRGLYFPSVIFVATVDSMCIKIIVVRLLLQGYEL